MPIKTPNSLVRLQKSKNPAMASVQEYGSMQHSWQKWDTALRNQHGTGFQNQHFWALIAESGVVRLALIPALCTKLYLNATAS